MKSIIRLPEVERRTAQSRTEIYKAMDAGTFPRPVQIGRRSIGWVEHEIDAYVERKIAERDQRAMDESINAMKKPETTK